MIMMMKNNNSMTMRNFTCLVLLLVTFVVVPVAAAAATTDATTEEIMTLSSSFEMFVTKYSKTYSSMDEYNYRKSIWERNRDKVFQHNNNNNSLYYTLELNQFADLLDHEVPMGLDKRLYTTTKMLQQQQKQQMKQQQQQHVITIHKKKQHEQQHLQQKSLSSNNPSSWKPQMEFLNMLSQSSSTSTTSSFEKWKQLVSSLPPSVDWRNNHKGGSPITTPVKNQGHCGSCWAFATIAALESHIALATTTNGVLFSLSMQELVSCSKNPNDCGGQGGCMGSTAELALDFISRHGIVEEWNFGYQSYRNKDYDTGNHTNLPECTIMPTTTSSSSTTISVSSLFHENYDNNNNLNNKEHDSFYLRKKGLDNVHEANSNNNNNNENNNDDNDVADNDNDNDNRIIPGAVASIVGFANLPSNQYDILLAAVATMGPIIVNIAASGWGLYQQGIFSDDNDETSERDINHVVVLEGYGTDPVTGQDYWLVRNSWGPLWGEEGYIRLKRVDPSTLTDPTVDCKMDTTPGDGIACQKDNDGNDIIPPPVSVCGTSGILYDPIVPLGAHLL